MTTNSGRRKKQFRRAALEKLRNIPKSRRYRIDKLITERLHRQVYIGGANHVMLYLPMAMEVDLSPLITQLRREGRRVYVPFMEGTSFRLVQYRLPLKTKKFGIKEPHDSNYYKKHKIDIAVVPVIGLDATLRRVGFGKGMYDRFFEKESKRIKQTVFVARELCYSPEIITDDYDIGAELIITC